MTAEEKIQYSVTTQLLQERLKQNLTQKELAKKAGVHENTVIKFERDCICNLNTFIKLSKALGLTVKLV